MPDLAMTRLTAMLLAAASSLGSAALVPASARACSAPEPAIFSRDMFPPPGATGVPTNAKVVVTYRAGASYGINIGYPVDAGDPDIGTDLELRRKGGAGVAIDLQNVALEPTGYDRVIGMVLTPMQPLASGVEYEVVDRHPTIPCGRNRPVSCALGAVTVVGSFTTAAGPDSQPPPAPTGPSLMARPAGPFDICTSSACCGPYVAKGYFVRWDESAPGTLLYNVYVGNSTTPVVRLYSSTELQMAVNCAGYGNPNAVWIMTGSVRVRAVDWAGNEGPALDLGTVPANACDDAPGDAGVDLGPLPGPDLPPDHPTVELPPDAGVAPDYPPGVDAARDVLHAPVDGPTSTPSPASRSSGGCQLGGSSPPAGPVALLLMLIAAVDLIRRRR